MAPGGTTDEVYGAGGSLLWRYTGNSSDPNQRAYVPFNGGILAEYWSGGTLFDHPDELGSISTSSDYTGNNLEERLFYPYGELWTGIDLNSFNMHRTFAQLADYDPEIDMYNTPNRRYSPNGRWPSPDPGGIRTVTLTDPQTWNMYAYAGNNPTTNVDPDGEDYYLLGGAACGDTATCDKQGYVLNGNDRLVVTDEQIQNGDVPYTLGANGVNTINGFQAQFFDNTPTSIDVTGTPGSAAATIGANLLIGTYNSVADDPWATSLTQFIMGRDYIPMPHLSGGEGAAAYSGLALAVLVPMFSDDPVTGKVHDDLAIQELKTMSRDELEHLAEKLRTSLKARMGELVGLGDKGNHGDRWTHQAQLLRAIEKILSGK